LVDGRVPLLVDGGHRGGANRSGSGRRAASIGGRI
jgi:hypothetical protein